MTEGTEMYTFNVQESPIELCTKCHSSFPAPDDFVFDKVLEHIHRKSPNDFCHAHEVPIFEPLLKEAEDRLSSYDATLDRLQGTLKRLQRQRSDLWRLKEQLRGLIKPSVRRLPAEVLLHIFSLCEDPEWGPTQCDASLILSHVCAPWRSMIFSEPSLWTDIFVDFGPRDDNAIAERALAFLRLCLDKSRARPLCVDFETPDNGYGSQPGYRNSDDKWVLYPKSLHRPCLEEVCKHSNRWKSATLGIHGCDNLEFADTMPYLEVLKVERATTRSSDEPWPKTCFPRISSPHLYELTIKDNTEDNSNLSVQLDTRALCDFTTDNRNVDAILGVLAKSPQLETVELLLPEAMFLPSEFFVSPGAIMTTSNIRSLEVHGNKSLYALFNFLHLPSLTLLKLPGEHAFLSELHGSSALVDLLRRSQPPLDTLDIRSMSFLLDELREILELCPSITTLYLSGCCNSPFPEQRVSRFLSQLLTVSASTPLLPNLSDLMLYDVTDIDVDMLVTMLESRQNWRRPGGIDSDSEQEQHFEFELKYSRSLEDSDEERLVGLSNERMTVTLSRSHGG